MADNPFLLDENPYLGEPAPRKYRDPMTIQTDEDEE